MTLIRFRYKLVKGRLQPIVTIGVQLGVWYPVNVYVDSGANCTLLQASFAHRIGFNYRTGQRIYLQVGDGSLIPVYLHDLEVQLGRERFTCPVGFSEQLRVRFNVLGKMGIFDRFKICFQEGERVLTFETHE